MKNINKKLMFCHSLFNKLSIETLFMNLYGKEIKTKRFRLDIRNDKKIQFNQKGKRF